ncbi:hypothetical protein C8F04DRAFT_1281962 [Mycena alexandri]|uniref:Uncharacterized protein n=1 Tax=Mycena alexandri TaxID=1745969 RepID=A0AAD6WPN3_9AGAR|nr:hypothetical protein C8F04DRAFT_1281962 [Mycena alexandri]
MLTPYVTSFAAIVLSFVVHVHATVSATVPISFPCAAYQPSTEHGVTHSHPRFMVVGALSLMFVVSALALRRAGGAGAAPPNSPGGGGAKSHAGSPPNIPAAGSAAPNIPGRAAPNGPGAGGAASIPGTGAPNPGKPNPPHPDAS